MFYLPVREGTSLSVEQVDVALANLETALGLPDIKVDHFILSLPHQSFDENGLDESEVEAFTTEIKTIVMPVWKKLSELRQSGRIGRLGVAEFSKQQLEILKNLATAESVNAVAPEVNQVNLQDCCVLPRDLIKYAKENTIELLTHGDAVEILPKNTFAALLEPHLPGSAASLTPNFVLKYSTFITYRGLISKKG
jgi:diketogulonate reductase-like aldo/keto reductase